MVLASSVLLLASQKVGTRGIPQLHLVLASGESIHVVDGGRMDRPVLILADEPWPKTPVHQRKGAK